MQLSIITPDRKVYEGEVESATFPGVKGAFQVLRNHAPIISSLTKGPVKYRNQAGESKVTITGGVVEVLDNNITLLAESVLDLEQ